MDQINIKLHLIEEFLRLNKIRILNCVTVLFFAMVSIDIYGMDNASKGNNSVHSDKNETNTNIGFGQKTCIVLYRKLASKCSKDFSNDSFSNISGSTVTLVGGNPLTEGNTGSLTFQVTNSSTDDEYIYRVDLTLPAGWTVVCNSQDAADSGGNAVNAPCSVASNVVTYTGEDSGFGEIHSGRTWNFTIDVSVPGGTAAGIYDFAYLLTGDGFGGTPHTVSNTVPGAITVQASGSSGGGSSSCPSTMQPSCYSGSLLQPGEVVFTCGSAAPQNSSVEARQNLANDVLAIYDIRDPQGNGATLGSNWSAPQVAGYHNADWIAQNMGEVYGLALRPNYTAGCQDIYVAQWGLAPGRVSSTTVWYEGDLADACNGGAVFKVDGMTGAVSQFACLPSHVTSAAPALTFDGGVRSVGTLTTYTGLGQITYNKECDVFYVSNFEDGLIYTLNGITGAIMGTYDFGVTGKTALGETTVVDDSSEHLTQWERRVFGTGYNPHEDKLYFGTVSKFDPSNTTTDFNTAGASQEIYSVDIDAGTCLPIGNTTVLQHQITTGERSPVSDIHFATSQNKMLISQMGMTTIFTKSAHNADIIELSGGAGAWSETATWTESTYPFGMGGSAGGVDYGYNNYGSNPDAAGGNSPEDAVVLTTDAALGINPPAIYGIQVQPLGGGNVATDAYLIDADGNTADRNKFIMGDIEALSPYCNISSVNLSNFACTATGATFTLRPDTLSDILAYEVFTNVGTLDKSTGNPSIDDTFTLSGINVSNFSSVEITVLVPDCNGSLECCFTYTLTELGTCQNCDLDISVNSNCAETGSNTFEGEWQVIVTYTGEPSGNIAYQRNSGAVGSFTPNTSPDTITITGVPVDGGKNDTIRVYFENDLTCRDSNILSRPLPCPDLLQCVIPACCESNLLLNPGLETYPNTFTFPFVFEGIEAERLGNGNYFEPYVAALDNAANITWLLRDGSDIVNNPEGDVFFYIKGQYDCLQYCGLDGSNCNMGSSLCEALEDGVTYELSYWGASWNETFSNSTPAGPGIQATTQAVFDLEYSSGTPVQEQIGPQSLPASTNFNTLNWQQYFHSFVYDAAHPLSTFYVSQEGNTGMFLDGLQLRKLPTDNCLKNIEPGEICSVVASDEIGGSVWKDDNFDGSMNESDTVGMQGIKVYLYDCAGAVKDSAYTDSAGNYRFTGLGSGALPGETTEEYRIEFVLPEAISCEMGVTQIGADNGGMIQFAEPGACSSLGLASAADFCDAGIFLVTPCFITGNNNGSEDVLVRWSYENEGIAALDKTAISTANQAASLWGLAGDKRRGKLYSSAVLKRHSGLHEGADGGGLDAIYEVNPFSAANAQIWLELDDDLGISVGSIPDNASRGLDTYLSHDSLAFVNAAKIGLGDIEISEDGNTLYVMNLFDKTVYAINIETRMLINSYPVPDPGCTNGTYRPWALAVRNGELYVGSICDGSGVAPSPPVVSDESARPFLEAFVYRLDGSAFTQIMNFPLDYQREAPFGYSGGTCTSGIDGWYGWVDEFQTPCEPGDPVSVIAYPQPILTDLEFDDAGNMILGFSDRTGFQIGYENYGVSGTAPLYSMYAAGDILFACNDGNENWTLENATDCTNSNGEAMGTSNNTYPSYIFNDGWPNIGEYFVGDFFHNGGDITAPAYFPGHGEITVGGLVYLPDSNEVVSTVFDPVTGGDLFNRGGVIKLSTQSGARTAQGFQLYDTENEVSLTGGKGVGLGDLESICAPPPIEIGSYVWLDENSDGIQDACEPGLENIRVELYDMDGNLIAFDTTDANGNYHFSHSDSTDQHWIAAQDSVEANTMYFILVGQGQFTSGSLTVGSSNYGLTIAGTGSDTAPEATDSDGEIGTGLPGSLDGFPVTKITTGSPGEMSHDVDFGFTASDFDLALKKTVMGSGTYQPGTDVIFDIRVYNQGNINATEVIVKDYIPSGMKLNDPNWASESMQVAVDTVSSLAPGDSTDLTITLRIGSGFRSASGNLINNAEITSALGGTDSDSDLSIRNDGSTNELTTDNDINDDGANTPGTIDNAADEDDYDAAQISVDCPTSICLPVTISIQN